MTILSSQFRHKAKIQERSEVLDQYGQQSVVWTDIASVWAGVENLSTTETSQAGAVNFIASHKVFMRYTPLINHKNRIVINGKNLKIVSIQNDQEINHTLTVICQEIVTDK